MKEIKYSRSRIERLCESCQKPIKKGDEYRMIGSQKRFAEAPWPICKKCDYVEPISWWNEEWKI